MYEQHKTKRRTLKPVQITYERVTNKLQGKGYIYIYIMTTTNDNKSVWTTKDRKQKQYDMKKHEQRQ